MRVTEPWERRGGGPMLGFGYWPELESACTVFVVLGAVYLLLAAVGQFANPPSEPIHLPPPAGGHAGYGYGGGYGGRPGAAPHGRAAGYGYIHHRPGGGGGGGYMGGGGYTGGYGYG